MGLGSMIFGDPERRRREKQQADLDRGYYERQKAYNAAKQQERIKLAQTKGQADAQKIATQKPLYKKILGLGQAIATDLTTGNPNQMFAPFQQPAPQHRAKRKAPSRKRKSKPKRKRQPNNFYPLI
jgi:hypothetical protein